ncbi:MAG: O-antigen ligase family protein, partial [Candidatus Promineifilaceae bacterium]
MSFLAWFPWINLLCTGIAAAAWYITPGLGAWPLLLAVIPWLIRLERTGHWDWRTPYDWPFLLFLITAAVAIWSAYDRTAALAKFWMILAAVLIFYAFVAFNLPGSSYQGRNWGTVPAWFLAAFGVVLTFYFLATHDWQEYPTKIAFLDALGRAIQAPLPHIPGHRLNPNVIGGMLAMVVPFTAAVTWISAKARRWLHLAAALAILSVTLFGLLLTYSRGAWIALAAAFTLLGFWWLAGLFSHGRPGRRRFVFLAILLLIAVLILLVVILRPDLPARLLNNLPRLSGESTRLELMRNSLDLVQDYPIIGAGLSSFPMLYASYAFLTHVAFIVHAHNMYLDIAIEQGLFGLLALIWMWLIFALVLWRKAGRDKLKPWLIAAAMALATMLIHGLVEDAFYGSRALVLFFTPLAFSMPYPRPSTAPSPITTKLVFLALGAALIIVLGVIFWRPLQSSAISNLAAVRQSQAELSLYSFPEWPIQDALRREIDLAPVIAGYEKALAINPGNTSANRRLGQIELSLGQYESVLSHLQSAYSAMTWDNAARQLYGEALIVNGLVDEGTALWQQVNDQQGQLSYREFWY